MGNLEIFPTLLGIMPCPKKHYFCNELFNLLLSFSDF